MALEASSHRERLLLVGTRLMLQSESEDSIHKTRSVSYENVQTDRANMIITAYICSTRYYRQRSQ